MTIASYADLLTTIADWTKRADMTARAPLFVAMGESAMNARLRLMMMEATEGLTIASGIDYATLPSRFIMPLTLAYDASNERLIQVDRESLDGEYIATAGRPLYYAYASGQVDFDRAADADYALTLRYVKRLDLAADSTNAVLNAAPFSYLYGALQAYARWIEDGDQLAQYAALFQQELRQLEDLDRHSRGSALLRTDLPMLQSSFDIYAGD
jgi:hypothetical protein